MYTNEFAFWESQRSILESHGFIITDNSKRERDTVHERFSWISSDRGWDISRRSMNIWTSLKASKRRSGNLHDAPPLPSSGNSPLSHANSQGIGCWDPFAKLGMETIVWTPSFFHDDRTSKHRDFESPFETYWPCQRKFLKNLNPSLETRSIDRKLRREKKQILACKRLILLL